MWREQAACVGMPLSVFFPRKGDKPSVVEAKRVCAGCPVQVPCLDDALLDPYDNLGIRAGTSAKDRQRERNRRGITRDDRRSYEMTDAEVRAARRDGDGSGAAPRPSRAAVPAAGSVFGTA